MQPVMGSAAGETVQIFYSSKTEPKLLDFYADSITYLKDSDIAFDIVDVEEDPERARKHDVVATPLVIVEQDGEEHRYFGIVDGLKRVLEDDLYGRSILHQLGFKEGRRFAKKHDLQDADSDRVEETLKSHLEQEGVDRFELTAFDPDKPVARGRVTPGTGESQRDWHGKLEEFLGGFFTEVFSTGVMGVETTCAKEGGEHCEFTVETQE